MRVERLGGGVGLVGVVPVSEGNGRGISSVVGRVLVPRGGESKGELLGGGVASGSRVGLSAGVPVVVSVGGGGAVDGLGKNGRGWRFKSLLMVSLGSRV